jgi:hypothetical protein
MSDSTIIEGPSPDASFRMTILQEPRESDRFRMVKYITGLGKALDELPTS